MSGSSGVTRGAIEVVPHELTEVLEYDLGILETLRHIEDICVKFSLQNYVAAGAVFLAHFAGKMPSPSLQLTAWVVGWLSAIFTIAIILNACRYNTLWKLHCIARNTWLEGQPDLSQRYRTNDDVVDYLQRTTLGWLVFAPMIVINLLPAIAAIVLRVR